VRSVQRIRKSADGGGATAEFAILLPAAVLIAATLLGVATQQLQAGSLGQKVGLLARAVELGQTDQQLQQLAQRLGVEVNLENQDSVVCITANSHYSLAGVSIGIGKTQACGLRPGG
jgi:hypothetical protein